MNYFFPAHREVPGGKRTRHGTPLPRLGLKTGIFFQKCPISYYFFTFSSVGHADNGLMPHRQPEPGLKREQQRRRVSNKVVPSRTPVVVTPNYSYPVTSPPPIQIQLILFYCSFLTLLFILVLLIVGEYKNLFFYPKLIICYQF